MEIVRFGVGHRRPEGPKGTRNVAGQVIHSGGDGAVSELAFGRRAWVEPHSNPSETWFVVIEGGGFVRVGDEQARVAAGEAVRWPVGVAHAAWTDETPMRALVIELSGAAAIVEGQALLLAQGEPPVPRAPSAAGPVGGASRPRYDPGEGEPF